MAPTNVKISGVVSVETTEPHPVAAITPITGARSLPTIGEASRVNSDVAIRQAFDQAAGIALQSSYQYEEVNVLIVRWEDPLDIRLRCGAEVEKLEKLLVDKFRYSVKVLKLNHKTPPQIQLDIGINMLLQHHDGPHRTHLLIVYYTGHGVVSDDSFKIAPDAIYSENAAAMSNPLHYEVDWNQATTNLKHKARADVLMIVDSCFAGVITKGSVKQMRTLEALLATGRKGLAISPGPRSFTTALIEALEETLRSDDEVTRTQFNTVSLRLRINELQQDDKVRLEPLINSGLHRSIKIVPLAKKSCNTTPNTSEVTESRFPTIEASTLTVRFSFGTMRNLDMENAVKFARMLADRSRNEMQDFNVSNIEWVDFAKGDLKHSVNQMMRMVRAAKVLALWRRRLLDSRKRPRAMLEDSDYAHGAQQVDSNSERDAKRPCTSLDPAAACGSHEHDGTLTPVSTTCTTSDGSHELR